MLSTLKRIKLPHLRTTIRSSSSSSSTQSMTPPTISLTPTERTLFTHLKNCAEWIDQNPHQVDLLRLKDAEGNWVGRERGRDKVELRVAGGWVRDKLLGQESDDIDISTSPDPITGLKFALLFQTYLSTISQSSLVRPHPSSLISHLPPLLPLTTSQTPQMGKLTAIEAKPEQSKHLETATAIVCGSSIDWVQQRGNEIYDNSSKGRIPDSVTFGTPLEDAERRDLTINSLFFNLLSLSVEDPTSKGLPDLLQKRIRTPVDDPFRTFLDDPLRVLRAVRFAARFGREWKIDEGLREAVGREEIQAALGDPTRISRERVGIELDKMFLGQDPLYALELIVSLNLYPLIFLNPPSPTAPATPISLTSDPDLTPIPAPNPSIALLAAKYLSCLLPSPSPSPPHFQTPLHPLLTLHLVPSPDPPPLPSSPTFHYPSLSPSSLSQIYPTTLKRLFLSCSLLPLYDYSTYDKKPTNKIWLGDKIVRDGIKWSNGDRVWVISNKKGWEVVSPGLIKWRESKGGEDKEREEIGMILRHLAVHDKASTRWNVTLLWSLIVDLVDAEGDQSKQEELIAGYNAFVERVLELGLEERAFAPSLLSGSDINLLIPSTKSSPAMASIIDLVVRYQLAFPERTKEECSEWITGEETRGKVEELVEGAKKLKKGKK